MSCITDGLNHRVGRLGVSALDRLELQTRWTTPLLCHALKWFWHNTPRALAQLAEQRSPKPQVGGSSPSCPAERRVDDWLTSRANDGLVLLGRHHLEP